MKRFDIITIFPKILDSYFQESLLKKAHDKGLIKIVAHNLRDFTTDKSLPKVGIPTLSSNNLNSASGHRRKVDDRPYGGGPGMVLKVEPIAKAVESIMRHGTRDKRHGTRVILLSLRGKKFDQSDAHRLKKYDQLIFICGRYEGVDERVAQYIADEEISIGDFVLSGGELGAAIIIEAVSRLVPGMLGKTESLEEIKGTYPVYTKPEVIRFHAYRQAGKVKSGKAKVLRVPKVLLSGDHKKIDAWRAGYGDM
ncbi:MAG: tRNA (guanine(37)-N(1))-methyltransferase [bacterium]|nr:tRNA (guanine(37)-N(1))-methyltransferase [bacterium]